MQKKLNISTIIRSNLFSMLILATGCDKFLDIAPPKTELDSKVIFSNTTTVNAAITAIYARMGTVNGTPFSNICWLTGLSADEFTNYATNQNVLAFYTNSLSSNNPNMTSYFWTPFYNMIFQANAIIEGLEENDVINKDISNQITGEAKFIRAFYHFYLTNLFGDVPVITSTDYRLNASLPRTPSPNVYNQIIRDLVDAKELLHDYYVGADGISSNKERVRPNKFTAQALLARVYLYIGENKNAEIEATEIIENNLYDLPTDLSSVFLKNSSESIWQIQPVANVSTTFADKFIITASPTSGINRSVTLSPSIIGNFQASDLRQINYIGTRTTGGNTFKYVNKHKVNVNNNEEYNMVLRLSEQYLIRAEARIKLGKVEKGLNDLNIIRMRANVDEYKIETIAVDPLLLVELERERELFAEGHRWFDLRRTHRIDQVMSAASPFKGGQWSSKNKLYPIPEIERTNNPNLSQNDDY